MSNRTWRTSPAALVNRVREAKADLVAAFGRRDPQRVENSVRKPAERRLKEPLFESSVVEWLDKHPATSPEGRCAWCGRAETADAAVLPYGTEPGTHVWLHTECWEPWQRKRRTEAVKSLALMGISPPPGDLPGLTPAPVRCERITQPEVGTSHLEQQCVARRGLVKETEGGALLHYCEKCGAFAPFGYGVSLRRGRLGRWYCAAHRPQDRDCNHPHIGSNRDVD